MNKNQNIFNRKLYLSFLNNKNNSKQISFFNNKIFQNKKLNSLKPIKKIIPKNYSFNENKDIKNINKNFNNLLIFNKKNISIDLKNKKDFLPNLSIKKINIKSFSLNQSNENNKNKNNNFNNLYLNSNNSFFSSNNTNNNENNLSNISIIKLTNENNNENENKMNFFDANSLKKLNLIKKLILELKEKNNKYINNELYKIFRDNVINIESKSTNTTNNYSDNDYINNFIKSNNTIKSNKTYNIENNNNFNNNKINNFNIKSSLLNIKKINKRFKIFKFDNKFKKNFSLNLTPLNNKSRLKIDLDYENDLYNLDSFRFYKKYPCHKTNLYYYQPNKKYFVRNKTYNNIPLLDLNYVNKNQHQNFDKFNEMIFNIQNQLDDDINDIMFDTELNNNKNYHVQK